MLSTGLLHSLPILLTVQGRNNEQRSGSNAVFALTKDSTAFLKPAILLHKCIYNLDY